MITGKLLGKAHKLLLPIDFIFVQISQGFWYSRTTSRVGSRLPIWTHGITLCTTLRRK